MNREDINQKKELLLTAKDFEDFVDLMNLPDSYKDCAWLERDYNTLFAHGEVYAQPLMLPEAREFKDFFADSTEGYGVSFASGMYYLCGDIPGKPDRIFNEKGKFYKSYAMPTQHVVSMIERIFGSIHRTRGFELIKWKNGKTLVLVHHGEVVTATGWLGVI